MPKTSPKVPESKCEPPRVYLRVGQIKVNDRLAAVCPPLSVYEYTQLEKSISKALCVRDALTVWACSTETFVVDGHNRLRIAEALGIKSVPATYMTFTSEDEAELWIIRNQLARRNLTDEQRDRLMACLAEAEEGKAGRPKKISAKSALITEDGNEHQIDANFESREKGKATERVAKQLGVGVASVERAIQRDKKRAAIAVADAEIGRKVVSGEIKIPKGVLQSVPAEEIVKSIKEGKPVEKPVKAGKSNGEEMAEHVRALLAGFERSSNGEGGFSDNEYDELGELFVLLHKELNAYGFCPDFEPSPSWVKAKAEAKAKAKDEAGNKAAAIVIQPWTEAVGPVEEEPEEGGWA